MKLVEIVRLYKSKGLRETEVRRIIAKQLGVTKEWVLAHEVDEFEGDIEELFAKLEKRARGYPLQYILGEVEFYGRTFKIEEGILIPRWETEGLVELALGLISSRGVRTVAEIGVGSGVIAVTIAAESNVNVLGTDINERAIRLSLENAELHEVRHLVDFRCGSFLEPFEERFDEIEMIVSNPPYVRLGVDVPIEVKHEPPEALYAGEDGLDFYREFFRRYATSGKVVLMEIGEDQGEKLKELTGGEVLKDLAGKDRYLLVERAD